LKDRNLLFFAIFDKFIHSVDS